jgi:hypothetical protein
MRIPADSGASECSTSSWMASEADAETVSMVAHLLSDGSDSATRLLGRKTPDTGACRGMR